MSKVTILLLAVSGVVGAYAKDIEVGPSDGPLVLPVQQAVDAQSNQVIRTVMRFYAESEGVYPAVPTGSKSAVIAFASGREKATYHVWAKDAAAKPATNRWVNTGIVATLGRDVSIVTKFVPRNGDLSVVWSFDGKSFGPVDVVGKGPITQATFSGECSVKAK